MRRMTDADRRAERRALGTCAIALVIMLSAGMGGIAWGGNAAVPGCTLGLGLVLGSLSTLDWSDK